MKLRSVAGLAGLAGFILASGCAAQNAEEMLNPGQKALIKATCQQVMHIGYHNEVDLAACTSSLADTLADKVQGDISRKSDKDCAAKGLARGSSQFSICVLDRQNAYAADASHNSSAPEMGPMPAAHLIYDARNDNPDEEYYDASFKTKRRREEYSCAQLGLDPGSGPFGQCVADLDASLFNADHPNP